MEFFVELLITALISVLLAFLFGKVSASAAAFAGPEAGLDPIEEEEEEKPKGESLSSRDACGGGVAVDESEVGERRLDGEVGGFDLKKENIEDEFSTEAEVDVPGVEESSAKKEDGEVEIGRIDEDLVEHEERLAKDEADVEKVVELGGEDAVEEDDASVVNGKEEGSLLHGEDDWEGIERSEVEKLFGVAAKFADSEKGGEAVSKLGNKVLMQLYGLHKVATEGPCYEPQPMSLKVSARAKWHAWQRLGSMNPEAAMEQYICLLSESIPGWMGEKPGEEAKGHDDNDSLAAEASQIGLHESKSSSQYKSETERFVGDSCSCEGATNNVDPSPKLFKEGLTKIFLFNLVSPTRVTF